MPDPVSVEELTGQVEGLAGQVETLARQVRQLVDIEAIRQTKYEYSRLADNGRYDEFEDLFTEDYTCELYFLPHGDDTEPAVTRFPSRDAWIEFVRRNGAARAAVDLAARAGAPGAATTPQQAGDLSLRAGMVHHMHGGRIELTGEDTARTIWPSYFGDGDDGTVGYYDEEYRREGGRWRIAREKFFAQALRRYKESDYPYPLEVGTPA
jgi:hypothetical protein